MDKSITYSLTSNNKITKMLDFKAMDFNGIVAVYILTHNRPETIMRALLSVQKQTFNKIKIIISDNSDNEQTANLVQPILQEDSRVEYVHRMEDSCQSGIGHLNYVLRTNPYDYFVMFHDDDEMLPNMVQILYESMIADSSIIAVGCNALLNINGRQTSYKTNSIKTVTTISDPISLIQMYVHRNIAPFPGYMYNRKLVSKSLGLVKSHGGKYSDSSFIVDLTKLGKILMLPKCGMIYYVTNMQDSYSHEFQQYDSLMNYWRNSYNCKEILKDARIYNIYNCLKNIQLRSGIIPFRKSVFVILLHYSTFNYFLKYLLRLLKVKTN